MEASNVRLENIGKRYDGQWVVRYVDLVIDRGEFFTLLGPSGCGKTTLLRIIAGFVAPDEGLVCLDGAPVNHLPPWRRGLGMVFQNYALWPHLSVFENVAFGLRERRLPKREIETRVRDAIALVGLTGTESRRPSQLSGGQQQRVALARTLVIQPRVLLLDEPLSNLDAKLRVEMRIELLKLQRDIGLTTIYVTHDQEEALAMSTRIAVLNQGRVVQHGTPREIYEHPADPFVAAFVGQSNLFAGRVVRAEHGIAEIRTDDALSLRAALLSEAPPAIGSEALWSVRPEAVHLHPPDRAPADGNRLPGKVSAAVYQGSIVEYEVATETRTIQARAIRPKGGTLFQRGDAVTVVFSPEDVVWVMPDAGRVGN